MVRAKQARQNECPHGVVTGSNSRLEHRLHSMSSECSTMRALLRMPSQLSVHAPCPSLAEDPKHGLLLKIIVVKQNFHLAG